MLTQGTGRNVHALRTDHSSSSSWCTCEKVDHLHQHCTPLLQATAQGVTNEELERAKRAAMASVYMNLESRAVVAEDIGRQILTYGHR